MDKQSYEQEVEVRESQSYPGLLSKVRKEGMCLEAWVHLDADHDELHLHQRWWGACCGMGRWRAGTRGLSSRGVPPLQYICHRVNAKVPGLPEGNFITDERRADGLLRHIWEWR